jgi:hypothetical protein
MMEVYFRNRTSSGLWVAIMYFSPDSCRDLGKWGTRGWWHIDPGGELYVLNTSNRYAAFYAESADVVWAGPYGPVYIHDQAFDHCYLIGDNNPNTQILGMRLVDTHNDDTHYVNLDPPE